MLHPLPKRRGIRADFLVIEQYRIAVERINHALDDMDEGWTIRASQTARDIFDESQREWGAPCWHYLDDEAEAVHDIFHAHRGRPLRHHAPVHHRDRDMVRIVRGS